MRQKTLLVDNTTHKVSQHTGKTTYVIGAVLVCLGLILFLSQYMQATWFTLMFVPAIGVILFIFGQNYRRFGLVISGSLVGGLGFGLVLAFNDVTPLPVLLKIGSILLGFSVGWFVISLVAVFTQHRMIWWPLVPGGIIGSLGFCMLLTPAQILDFVLYLGFGIGLPFLVWGIYRHILGLIIPGCIVLTTGIGIYMAWQDSPEPNNLSQTGVMLVWFAIGWGLITLLSRSLFPGFLWWPLIPGGVLAMVGWGFYLGGNPNNASSFISNTGSIALIIIGLYLLLIRRGIQH